MKKFSSLTMAFAGLAALAFNGCCCGKNVKEHNPRFSSRIREEVVAVRAADPIVLDGKLDEADWKNAPAYALVHPLGQYGNADWDVQEFFSGGVVEPGSMFPRRAEMLRSPCTATA